MNFSIQSVYNWYRNLLRNPKYRWWVILATALYFVSPIDVIPDFFPLVGELDDVFLLSLLVSEVSQMVIEGAKARSKSKSVNKPSNNAENPTSTAATVDVEAVSVK